MTRKPRRLHLQWFDNSLGSVHYLRLPGGRRNSQIPVHRNLAPPRRRRAENLPPLEVRALKFCPPLDTDIGYIKLYISQISISLFTTTNMAIQAH